MGEVNSVLEDDIDNVMNDSGTQFMLEESLENELDSDYEPLNLLVPELSIMLLKKLGGSKVEKEKVKKMAKEKAR